MSSTLADLQRRNIAQMNIEPIVNIEPIESQESSPLSPSVSTELRKPVSTDALTEASEEGITEVREEARSPVRKPVRKSVSTGAAPDFLDVVEAALVSREPLTGGVKATVDMSPELSSRAKRYLADHRGQSTRQVLIALFDAFLTGKGY